MILKYQSLFVDYLHLTYRALRACMGKSWTIGARSYKLFVLRIALLAAYKPTCIPFFVKNHILNLTN